MREHNHHMPQRKELNLPNGETKDETMIKMLALAIKAGHIMASI